jgi:hypothetical protein
MLLITRHPIIKQWLQRRSSESFSDGPKESSRSKTVTTVLWNPIKAPSSPSPSHTNDSSPPKCHTARSSIPPSRPRCAPDQGDEDDSAYCKRETVSLHSPPSAARTESLMNPSRTAAQSAAAAAWLRPHSPFPSISPTAHPERMPARTSNQWRDRIGEVWQRRRDRHRGTTALSKLCSSVSPTQFLAMTRARYRRWRLPTRHRTDLKSSRKATRARSTGRYLRAGTLRWQEEDTCRQDDPIVTRERYHFKRNTLRPERTSPE